MRVRPLVIFLIATAVGLLNFSIAMTSWRAESNLGSAKYPFVWEMTGAYTVLVLLPLVLFMASRYPITRRTIAARVPLHLATFLVFAVSHTLLMWGSREAIYALLGWGAYDYGDMRYRFFMEGQKQLIIYALIYATVRFAAYARANRERDIAAAGLERELTEARLAALKAQLQPHFLFNTLNMIASHVHDQPELSQSMLEHLSNFLRATLRQKAPEVPLHEEIEFLDSYLEIMRARFEERLHIRVSLPADVRGTLVPHLLLQPLVENSIAHTLRDHARRAEISIAAVRDGERLRVTIEDNGPGIGAGELPANGGGIGLSNTIARLQHLYGERQRLQLTNRDEGGLRLTIELPWHTEAA